MSKIGAITIGQAPRTDVTCDIMEILGDDTTLIQSGGLDGLTHEEIEKFAPQTGDYVLVSRLRDGTSVKFAERFILPRLQECINKLEAQGAELIMFFCTGDFPDTFSSHVPLIFPCKILNGLVPALMGGKHLIVVTPDQQQVAQSQEKWKNYVQSVTVVNASPYGEAQALESAAEKIREMDGDLIVLDCIGYTSAMKEMFAKITGKHVVLSRTILARAVRELTDI